MTPLGPPGEDGLILLGHSALDPLSLSACQLTTIREHFPWKTEGEMRRIQTSCNDKASCNAAKETRKETQQKCSGPEGDHGRICLPLARNHGRPQARPQEKVLPGGALLTGA